MSSRNFEDAAFTTALALSVVGHVMLLFLQKTPEDTEAAETAIEERQALAPMTVRVVLQEALQVPVLQAEATPPLLTSEGGERVVESIELEPEEFQRVRPDLPPPLAPPVELPESTTRKPEPQEEVFDLPERPQDREAPAPEPPTDLAKRQEVEAPEPQLVESQAQSEVVARKAAPDVKRNRPPKYPPRARAARMQGVTEVRVFVDEKGRVTRAELASTSGHEILDDEAIKTVKRWRFSPATRADGAAVSDVIVVPVRFRLR